MKEYESLKSKYEKLTNLLNGAQKETQVFCDKIEGDCDKCEVKNLCEIVSSIIDNCL